MSAKSTSNAKHSMASICSFCSQKIRLRPEQVGQRCKCPKCGKTIRLLTNAATDVTSQLRSTWYYTKSKMVILREDVGPVSDDKFLDLVDRQVLGELSDVRSPDITGDEWVPLSLGMIAGARELQQQRVAEIERLNAINQRKELVRRENQSRIRNLIRGAISDGVLSSSEQSEISKFAERAKLDAQEVSDVLRAESKKLVFQLLEESLDDGILDPDEERKIAKYAKGLGVPLELNDQQTMQISLSRIAWKLNHSTIEDMPEVKCHAALTKGEVCIASTHVNWNEIVELKRPKGVPLGNGRYLKEIGSGECYLTQKHVLFSTPYESKKARLSSVAQVSKHSDGIFLNRSTGKSLFLRAPEDSEQYRQFALTLDWIVSGVVQANFIDHSFIPVVEPTPEEEQSFVSAVDYRDPRFTFRVVGDHVGDRSIRISQLGVADRLILRREPLNPYDTNAVMVLDGQENVLGYLKRDVAEWFGPRMDSGRESSAEVHRIRDDGALIVGVYE